MSESLRSLVLRRRLKAPVQNGYSADDWNKALGALSEPSEEDQRLHRAAIFFGEQLQGLRANLDKVPPPPGNTVSKIRRAIGFVNRESLTAKRMVVSDLPNMAWVDELVQKKIPLAGGINTATIDEVVEGLVDGLRIGLASLINQSISPAVEILNSANPLGSIVARANISSFYHFLEEQWLDCLHRGWEIRRIEKARTLLVPLESSAAIDWTVALHRAQVLDMELIGRSMRIFERQGSTGSRGIITQGSGKRQVYSVARVSADTFVEIMVAQMLAAEPDLVPFMEVDLGIGLSANELLKVWAALVPLAADLESKLDLSEKILTVGQLEQYAAPQDETNLLNALQRSTELPWSKCAAALRQLTWRGVRDSLWHRPLVKVENSRRLFIVLPALRHPNLRRSVEYWLVEGGADLEGRGSSYEQYVRREIGRGIRSNKVLQNAGVLSMGARPPEPSIGDLDLVFWVGNTIVVGEIKCLLRPAATHDWFKYEDRVSEAVRQTLRKSNYVKHEPAWLLKALKEAGADIDPPQVKVVPCVVLNSPLGTLRTVQGIPIVDLYILLRYLEGSAVMYGSLTDATTGSRIRFYADGVEAEARLGHFLHDPDHLRPYKRSVQWEKRYQPDFVVEGGVVQNIFPVVKVDLPKPAWVGDQGTSGQSGTSSVDF